MWVLTWCKKWIHYEELLPEIPLSFPHHGDSYQTHSYNVIWKEIGIDAKPLHFQRSLKVKIIALLHDSDKNGSVTPLVNKIIEQHNFSFAFCIRLVRLLSLALSQEDAGLELKLSSINDIWSTSRVIFIVCESGLHIIIWSIISHLLLNISCYT